MKGTAFTEFLESARSDEALYRAKQTGRERMVNWDHTWDRHANCFIAKPVGLNQFVEVVRSIERFWVTIVTLRPDDDESSLSACNEAEKGER
jgi:two-component system, chemotaxis family, response regulator Rcp1